MMNQSDFFRRVIKPALFIICLVPFLWLTWDAYRDNLGANPVEAITHRTGDWTLRMLLITLAITPVRRLTGLRHLLRLRRMLGLFAFFYACLHFLTYIWIDQFFDLTAVVEDIAERLYITAGFTTFVLLIPLALTSPRAMVRRLGARRWQRLHRLIYIAGLTGVTHYLWLVKSDLAQPLLYAMVLALLLGLRLWWWARPSASGAMADSA